MRQKQEASALENETVSWWSWRPGIKPRNAFIIGGLLSLVALLLLCLGLFTLIFGIEDSVSQPLQVPGIVTQHRANSGDGQLRLRIRVHTTGFSDEIVPVVSEIEFHSIRDGDTILLDYSPNLHILYALEGNGQRYVLPNSGSSGIFVGAVALLLLGSVLLLYPAVLAYWGWRDLYERRESRCEITGKVISLRAAAQTRAGRPGLTPRPTRTWYGVALFFFSSRRRHTIFDCDWSSDVCSSDLRKIAGNSFPHLLHRTQQMFRRPQAVHSHNVRTRIKKCFSRVCSGFSFTGFVEIGRAHV